MSTDIDVSSSVSLDGSVLVELALAHAASLASVSAAYAIVTDSAQVNLRWALTSLTTNGRSHRTVMSVGVISAHGAGFRLGTLSQSVQDASDVRALVEAAAARAAEASAAEDGAELTAGFVSHDFAEPAQAPGPDIFAQVATDLGGAFERNLSSGRELFGYAEYSHDTMWLGTSTGTRYRWVQPTGSVELNGKSHGRSRSAWVAAPTRDFRDVDVLTLDAQIAERLAWQERTVQLPAGRYRTLLPPAAMADLLVYWYWEADARAAYEGRSAFAGPNGTRINEALTEVPLSIFSDPGYPGLECADVVVAESSGGSMSAFDNGLDVGATLWLDRGRLAALPSSRFSAALAGVELHPMVDNLIARHEEGQGTEADLIGQLDDGLLLTCLWYTRDVDPLTMLLTGLTRDGVYQVKDGEVVGAVNNFRYNDSPMDILRRVDVTGETVPTISREWSEYFPRTAMPPAIVNDFHMSSASEAQ